MGMLRDLRATSKAAKSLSADWDPAAQMRQGLTMMQRMTETLQVQAEAASHQADMVQAQATVLRLTPTGASINDARVVRIDLLVWLPDGSQRPAVVSSALELTELASYQPGTSISVRVDPKHPDRVLLSR
jgi:hypothetical protein